MRLRQPLQKQTCPGEARLMAQVTWGRGGGAVGSLTLGWLQWESQGTVFISVLLKPGVEPP